METVAIKINIVNSAVRVTTVKDVIRKFRSAGRKVITIRRNMMLIDFELVNRWRGLSMRVIGMTMTTDGRITGTRKRKKLREFERKMKRKI